MADALVTGGQPKVNDTKSYNNGVKVVPSMLLEPVSVDKSNYEQTLIKTGYLTPDEVR
jgi:putative multiple sugar transport system substrate-binding protein